MELYPAVDLRDGAAVRLTQGDFARQVDYGDPLVLAASFVAAGAPWLHVVDLSAARTGVRARGTDPVGGGAELHFGYRQFQVTTAIDDTPARAAAAARTRTLSRPIPPGPG